MFDQLQGILYVAVPIRMTVVKLEKGGLLVYAPIAPTPECLRLLNELTTAHGDVRYIILPTISGLEHKVFVGPFARRFPTAQIFVAPGQWSFPLNLPLSWLGFPAKRTHVLPQIALKLPLPMNLTMPFWVLLSLDQALLQKLLSCIDDRGPYSLPIWCCRSPKTPCDRPTRCLPLTVSCQRLRL